MLALHELMPAFPEASFPVVEVVVAHYQEPVEELAGTLRGCLDIDYPPEKLIISILDDGYFRRHEGGDGGGNEDEGGEHDDEEREKCAENGGGEGGSMVGAALPAALFRRTALGEAVEEMVRFCEPCTNTR